MKTDIAIIGAGPGGYVSAIRCSQLGYRTLLIEKQPSPGGTCLAIGCIPTKTLLEISGHYHAARKQIQKYGIGLDNLTLDYSKVLNRKDTVIQQNSKGIEALLKKNGIQVITGEASFVNDSEIDVREEKGNHLRIEATHTIIATGATAFGLPFVEIDHQRILTSTEMLSLAEVPESLAIVGAGVIGLELGTHFARLGTAVKILDIADSILPNFDNTVGKELTRSLKKLGIKFHLSCNISNITNAGTHTTVTATDSTGKSLQFDSDYCLIATGRKPMTEDLGLENTSIKTNDVGAIKVNRHLQTTAGHIYAIGDVIGGTMLAHKASEEGIAAAETIAGMRKDLNYQAIPSVVYTSPETASVGCTEQELIVKNITYKVGLCQNRTLGRAHTADKLDGLAKVLISAETDEILGVHLVAPHASEMIGEAVVAIEQKLTATALADMSHPHPTFLEAIKEACLSASGKAIHAM